MSKHVITITIDAPGTSEVTGVLGHFLKLLNAVGFTNVVFEVTSTPKETPLDLSTPIKLEEVVVPEQERNEIKVRVSDVLDAGVFPTTGEMLNGGLHLIDFKLGKPKPGYALRLSSAPAKRLYAEMHQFFADQIHADYGISLDEQEAFMAAYRHSCVLTKDPVSKKFIRISGSHVERAEYNRYSDYIKPWVQSVPNKDKLVDSPLTGIPAKTLYEAMERSSGNDIEGEYGLSLVEQQAFLHAYRTSVVVEINAGGLDWKEVIDSKRMPIRIRGRYWKDERFSDYVKRIVV